MKKKYKRETYETRKDWITHRGIGGSSASAIVGLNPYQTALDLFNACIKKTYKKDRNEEEQTTNPAIRYGTDCEPLIRKIFILDHPELTVHEPDGFEMYRRKDKRYLTATLDGRIYDNQRGQMGILEIKTHDVLNRDDLAKWEGSIPANYLIQTLHYLVVMNDCTFVKVVAKLRFYDYSEGGRKLTRSEIREYHIERSEVEKELEWLESKETEFFEENVLKKIPPRIEIKF